MKLKKFNYEDLLSVKSTKEAYEAMGLPYNNKDEEFGLLNKETFGEKAQTDNIVINDDVYKVVLESIAKNGGNLDLVKEWKLYAPTHDGERYETLMDIIGEPNRSVVYVFTPDDPDYLEYNPNKE